MQKFIIKTETMMLQKKKKKNQTNKKKTAGGGIALEQALMNLRGIWDSPALVRDLSLGNLYLW